MTQREFKMRLEAALESLTDAINQFDDLAQDTTDSDVSDDFKMLVLTLTTMYIALGKGDVVRIAMAVSKELNNIIEAGTDNSDAAVRDLIRGIDGINLN